MNSDQIIKFSPLENKRANVICEAPCAIYLIFAYNCLAKDLVLDIYSSDPKEKVPVLRLDLRSERETITTSHKSDGLCSVPLLILPDGARYKITDTRGRLVSEELASHITIRFYYANLCVERETTGV